MSQDSKATAHIRIRAPIAKVETVDTGGSDTLVAEHDEPHQRSETPISGHSSRRWITTTHVGGDVGER